MSVDNNTKFLNSNFDLEDNEGGNEFIDFVEDQDLLASDPVEIIVARVLFALLVSVSLVINLLLVLAVGRRWKTVHLIYILAASMALPDLVFYSKLVAELVNSWERSVPPWTTSGKQTSGHGSVIFQNRRLPVGYGSVIFQNKRLPLVHGFYLQQM